MIVWGTICLGVGAGFLYNARRLRRDRVRFLRTAVRTRATVTAVRTVGVGRNAVAIPVFEFATAGRTLQRAESVQPSGFTGAAVGQTVAILYDPAQPSRADIDTFRAIWGLALLRAAFGTLFALVGLTAILLAVL